MTWSRQSRLVLGVTVVPPLSLLLLEHEIAATIANERRLARTRPRFMALHLQKEGAQFTMDLRKVNGIIPPSPSPESVYASRRRFRSSRRDGRGPGLPG